MLSEGAKSRTRMNFMSFGRIRSALKYEPVEKPAGSEADALVF
jgi:hypothetical protein